MLESRNARAHGFVAVHGRRTRCACGKSFAPAGWAVHSRLHGLDPDGKPADEFESWDESLALARESFEAQAETGPMRGRFPAPAGGRTQDLAAERTEHKPAEPERPVWSAAAIIADSHGYLRDANKHVDELTARDAADWVERELQKRRPRGSWWRRLGLAAARRWSR